MNDLAVKLFASRIGCHIEHVATNNIWYADDLCLLAPSIYALQNMINICNHYVNQHNITLLMQVRLCVWSLMYKLDQVIGIMCYWGKINSAGLSSLIT